MNLGDLVLLTNKKDGSSYLIKIEDTTTKIKGLGVVNVAKFLEMDLGETHTIGLTEFILTDPTLIQKIEHLERKAQVINAKDIPMILFYGDVANASLVIEGGVGSGFLTCSLASTIPSNAKVISYELRQDFADFAQKNIDRLGLTIKSLIKIGDITKGIEERNVDLVVVDIPNPEDCVEPAINALKPGGVFISYVPLVNQMESCVKAMREIGFSKISSFETLHRNMVVGEHGSRPDFSMLGHTGYLIIGYKI